MIPFRALLPLVAIALLCISCSSETEEEHYSDGGVKLKAEMQNGKRHGLLVTYFTDGAKESESQWENNQLHGRKVTYYNNGKLKSEEMYQHGLQHGPYKTYSVDGGLTHEANYKLGKRVGEVRYYRPDGKLERLYKYNENGQYYSAFYDKEGKFETDMYQPTFIVQKDTVKLGEEYAVIIQVPEPLIGKATIHIGTLDAHGRLASFTDTLRAQDHKNYTYSVRPQEMGENVIAGSISLAQSDAHRVSAFDFKHKFYVIE